MRIGKDEVHHESLGGTTLSYFLLRKISAITLDNIANNLRWNMDGNLLKVVPIDHADNKETISCLPSALNIDLLV